MNNFIINQLNKPAEEDISDEESFNCSAPICDFKDNSTFLNIPGVSKIKKNINIVNEKYDGVECANVTNYTDKVSPNNFQIDSSSFEFKKLMKTQSTYSNSKDIELFESNVNENPNKKGFNVQNQMKLYDNLLECRIKFNKTILNSNRLSLNLIKHIDTTELQSNSQNLLKSLFEMKQILHGKQSSTPRIITTLNNISDISNLITNSYIHEIENVHCILRKWCQKVQVLKRANRTEQDIVTKIDNTIKAQANILIKRSQNIDTIKETLLGRPNLAALETDPNVFNDSDFYHKLLRDIIESRNSYIENNIHEIQNIRKTLKKSKIDIRASKGRKIRYATHKKLVNFKSTELLKLGMVYSRDELYKSLFF